MSTVQGDAGTHEEDFDEVFAVDLAIHKCFCEAEVAHSAKTKPKVRIANRELGNGREGILGLLGGFSV